MPETTIQKQTGTVTRLMPLFRILIHNDDHNEMIYVCKSLQEVFGFEKEQCIQIMLEAHETGCALCKIEPLETAELHQEQLQAFGLTATIEPED